jgi:hypothetical protein
LLKIRFSQSQLLILAIISVLCALPILVPALAQTKRHLNQTASENSRMGPARLRENVSVHAAGRGNPSINLSDGHELVVPSMGANGEGLALEQNQAEPLSLAAADFDEDGVPDLITGYRFDGGGIVTLLRGNVDSIYPNSPEAVERRAAGTFTEAPFLSPARVFNTSVAADFVGTGDFDADGHWDVLVAQRGGRSLSLLAGDGHGGFAMPKEIALPGSISAFTTGEINRADGSADVVVGIEGEQGPQLLVFEGPEGALKATPEVLSLSAPAISLALGQLDDGYEMDLAVAAGNDLVVLHGRDRKLSLGADRQATVRAARLEKRSFDVAVTAVAIGDFTGEQRSSLAVLTTDGAVQLLSAEKGTDQKLGDVATWQALSMSSARWPQAVQLVSAKVSSLPGDDLLVVDRAARQVEVLVGKRPRTDEGVATEPGKSEHTLVSLDVEGGPAGVLPMQLNADALSDLALIKDDASAPTVVLSAQFGEAGVGGTATATKAPFAVAPGSQMADMAAAGQASQSSSQSQPKSGGPITERSSKTLTKLAGDLAPQDGCVGTPIAIGQTINGTLTTADCPLGDGSFYDTYTFSGSANQQIAIALSSASFDTFLFLVAPDGSALESDDDGGGGTNSRIPAISGFFTLPLSGTYTIRTNSFFAAATGAYSLTLTANTTVCQTTTISMGQTVNGALTTTDCLLANGQYVDIYRFSGSAGQQVSILMTSANIDTYLYLLAPDGSLQDFDDDGGGGTDSRIPSDGGFFTLPATGTYTIRASSFFAGDSGSYTLTLSQNVGCPITPIRFGQTVNGALANGDCVLTGAGTRNGAIVDTYSFAGFIGQQVAVGMSASFDTYLYLVAPGAGGAVYEDDDGGGGTNSRIPPSGFLTLPATGSYTIYATSFSPGLSGNYSLSLSLGTPLSTVVTNTNDSGAGSLRQAILNANANPGAETIRFSIGSGFRSISPFSVLPTITDPVTIDGTTQPGFGGAPIIELNGSFAGTGIDGIKITSGSSRVRGLVINRFGGSGISISTSGGNIIDGNYIGTNAAGTGALGNGQFGVAISSANSNTIGGTAIQARNLISGNGVSGIFAGMRLNGNSSFTQVSGNFIGTDVTGNVDLGNTGNGVYIFDGSNNVIGTTVPGAGNLVSGNDYPGIAFAYTNPTGNLVQGNFIGTNPAGTAAVPNFEGVIIGGYAVGGDCNGCANTATNNTVGGTVPNSGNLISGNTGRGLEILNVGSLDNRVQGNYIGTNLNGNAALPNTRSGVFITAAPGNDIGGRTAGSGNLISGNRGYGVGVGIPDTDPNNPNTTIVGGKGIDVLFNYIGTDITGRLNVGNGLDGLYVDADSVSNTIEGNVIAFNAGTGVKIPNRTNTFVPGSVPGVRININSNSIFANTLQGIDLGDAGVTPNDPLDADVGANLQQNFPVLSSYSLGPPPEDGSPENGVDNPLEPRATVTVNGTLNSTRNSTFIVHWDFSGDAQCVANQELSQSLDSGKVFGVATDSNGNASFTFTVRLLGGVTSGIVNSTAADAQGNTSEYSSCLAVSSLPPPSVQFSAATYPVAEASPGAAVVVTRSGNNAVVSTVNYTTSDTAGTANCNVSGSGKASSRCDYETTAAALTFAPGESSKTIFIPIVDDVYAEGGESFSVALSSPSGATLGSLATATVTIGDNDSTTGVNPLAQAPFFTRLQYYDFLNRDPDPSGLAFWTNEITSCGSNAQCIEIKRINVSAAFFLSIEFQETGYLVERIYKAAYGNASGASTLGGNHQLPVPVIRFSEFTPDTQQIGQGVIVGQTGWEQVLENNKQAFLNAFVQRTRFVAIYSTVSSAQYVDALNSNAGNALSTAERNQLVSDLTLGAKTRAQALRAVAEDADLFAAEKNRAFVLAQYFGYLRRNPNDAPDADYTGYDYWLGKLNQFNGNFVTAEMVKAFINADEYKHRFGP